MSNTVPLDPESTHIVEFLGEFLDIAMLAEPIGYISIPSICRAFDIDDRAQRRRIKRNLHYFNQSRLINMPTAKGDRATLCLFLPALPLFLTSIRSDMVNSPEKQKMLEIFRDDSQDVLAEYWGLAEKAELQFLRNVVGQMVDEHFEDTTEKKADGGAHITREEYQEKLAQMRIAFSEIREQVRTLERHIGSHERLTSEQIGDIKNAVNTLADLRKAYEGTESPWQQIYSHITSVSGVGTIREIRLIDYPRVMRFLETEIKAMEQEYGDAG